MQNRVASIPSGQISYLEMGDPQGVPGFFFHGVPGSSRQVLAMQQVNLLNGCRLIAFDRPGFGDSKLPKNRKLSDSANIVRELADHLGIERFHLVGVSGGAPHAFVAADKLRDRVISLTTIGGLGPLDEPDLVRAFPAFGRRLFWMARWAPWMLTIILSGVHKELQKGKTPNPDNLRKYLPEEDVKIVVNPEIREVFRESMRHAFRQGSRGPAVEMRVFQEPWGITNWNFPFPVRLWHGMKDGIVPPLHSQSLARRIPGAELHEIADEAHYSLPIMRAQDILAPLK